MYDLEIINFFILKKVTITMSFIATESNLTRGKNLCSLIYEIKDRKRLKLEKNNDSNFTRRRSLYAHFL